MQSSLHALFVNLGLSLHQIKGDEGEQRGIKWIDGVAEDF